MNNTSIGNQMAHKKKAHSKEIENKKMKSMEAKGGEKMAMKTKMAFRKSQHKG